MVTMSSNQHRGAVKAFTLIELLVVISIIALLISILLPALSNAKRRVKVLYCMANLQQLGIGFSTYYSEHGEYPPNETGSPGVIYYSGFRHDNRDRLIDVSGGNGDIYWCPLFTGWQPERNTWDRLADNPLYDRYHNFSGLGSGTAPGGFWFVSYYMYLLCVTEDTATAGNSAFDYTRSGNPPGPNKDHSPRQFGSSDAVIIADQNVNWPSHCGTRDPFKPCFTQHTDPGLPFIDSDRLYADGHVVSTSKLEYWVYRPTPNAFYPY